MASVSRCHEEGGPRVRVLLIMVVLIDGAYFAWGSLRELPTPSPVSSLPSAVASIRLLAELPPLPAVQACQAFGTYEDETEAVRATTEIAAAGLEPIVQEEATESPTDRYLVYIGTDGSRSEAKRLQRELQSRSIDCEVIPTGTLADSLSVGVFRHRDLADAHLKRLAELGYEADLRMLMQQRKLYHVFAPRSACQTEIVALRE
jgi:SPOR domain